LDRFLEASSHRRFPGDGVSISIVRPPTLPVRDKSHQLTNPPVPFDALAFVIILVFLDVETPKTPIIAGLKAIDWIGVITITGGTIMFLLGLEYGGVSFPWTSATVLSLLIFGVLTIILFFLNEWKLAKYPMMPLKLFSVRSNIASLAVCFVHGFVFISGAYFYPLYFQAVLGANPILSGVYLFPFVLSLSIASMIVGIFIKKTGQYLPPIYLGVLFMTIGFGLYIDLPNGRTWGRIFPFQVIAGIGVGPNFQAPLIALQTNVEPRDIATATATFGFVRQLATAISVVIGGVIFQNEMMNRESTLRAAVGPSLAQRIGGGGAGAATGIVRNLPEPGRSVATGVYTASLRTMWIFYVCISALSIVAAAFIGNKKLKKTHEVYKTGLEEEERNRLERERERKEKRESKRLERMSADAQRKENKRLSRLSGGVSGRNSIAVENRDGRIGGDTNV
jgi:hypothetical protein